MSILMFCNKDINVFDSKVLLLALLGVLCNKQCLCQYVAILNSEKSQIIVLNLSPMTLNRVFL